MDHLIEGLRPISLSKWVNRPAQFAHHHRRVSVEDEAKGNDTLSDSEAFALDDLISFVP